MKTLHIFVALMALCCLAIANLYFGSVHIPFNEVTDAILGCQDNDTVRFIVMEHRLPQAVTALLVGASLAVCGLLLQTTFHNPLAGPSVFGISGGASLGVALLLLGGIAGSANPGDGLVVMGFAAFVGAMTVTAVLLFVSNMIKNNVVLLIVGLLFGYLISSVITILYVVADPESLHQYMVWGMGDFSSVSRKQLLPLGAPTVVFLIVALLLVKPLNAMQMGDNYAQNLGVDIRKVRNMVLLVVGVLTAVSTTFCGPVAFLGLAVPHITRFIVRTSDYRVLLPSTLFMGAMTALVCNLICVIPSGTLLPLNAVTPLVGIPVIIYVVVKR